MLQRNFSGVPVELFKRMSTNSGKGCKYSPQLKSFALTLQFYSAKAYDFVRKTFNLALPHPVQIRKWCTKVPGINESWKIPVGYFFIDGLSRKERANLIKVCLKKLHDVGIDVISLICDGPSCHFAMLQALGGSVTASHHQAIFFTSFG